MGNTKKQSGCPFLTVDGWTRCNVKVRVANTGDDEKDFQVMRAVNRADGEYHYQREDGVFVGYWKSYIYTATNPNAEKSALSLGAFYVQR